MSLVQVSNELPHLSLDIIHSIEDRGELLVDYNTSGMYIVHDTIFIHVHRGRFQTPNQAVSK